MSFLGRVEAAADDLIMTVDDVYKNDPQYSKLVDSVAELIRRLANKFEMNEDGLYTYFIKHLKEEL